FFIIGSAPNAHTFRRARTGTSQSPTPHSPAQNNAAAPGDGYARQSFQAARRSLRTCTRAIGPETARDTSLSNWPAPPMPQTAPSKRTARSTHDFMGQQLNAVQSAAQRIQHRPM